MVTKHGGGERFVMTVAPRSGKTWEMLRRHDPKTGVIIASSEERKRWLEEMAKHAHFAKPNVVVWKPDRKPDTGQDFQLIVIDDVPMLRMARMNGKPTVSAIRLLDEIEKRLLKQCPYPYADIALIRQMRVQIYGEW